MMDLELWFKDQPRKKIVFAGLFSLIILYIIFFNHRDAEYYKEVAHEVELAAQLCENSTKWALDNERKMLLTQNSLRHIKVDGKEVEFKYLDYPRAVLLHNGFVHENNQSEYYCTFTDPRGRAGRVSGEYFFDYRTKSWLGQTWSR